MSPHIWGPSARTFDPSRWLSPSASNRSRSVPDIVPDGPGVWPNVLTFIDGPRRCVGYKLALIEMKIVLFCLVRILQFEVVEGKELRKWNL